MARMIRFRRNIATFVSRMTATARLVELLSTPFSAADNSTTAEERGGGGHLRRLLVEQAMQRTRELWLESALIMVVPGVRPKACWGARSHKSRAKNRSGAWTLLFKGLWHNRVQCT
jgi:hypothetical protein